VRTERGLHGKGGAKSLATHLVVGTFSEQVVDEAVEMAMHAVAPWSSCRHGNDVDLPQFSDLQVVFGRPVTVPGQGAPLPQSQPPSSNPPPEPEPN